MSHLDATVAKVTKLPRVADPPRSKRRLRPHHQDDVRTKIQTSHIINRLQNHLDGKIELTPTQVACGKILLDRTVPVLSAVEQTVAHVIPDESELVATIQRLIAGNPQLLHLLRPAIDVTPNDNGIVEHVHNSDAAPLSVDNSNNNQVDDSTDT